MSSSCGRRRRRTRCQRTGRDGARTDEEDVRRRARRRSIGTNERTTDATRLDDDALHLLVRDVDLERVEHLAPEVLRVDVREVFLVRDHGVRPRCGCVGGGARGGSDDERNARRVTMTRGTFPQMLDTARDRHSHHHFVRRGRVARASGVTGASAFPALPRFFPPFAATTLSLSPRTTALDASSSSATCSTFLFSPAFALSRAASASGPFHTKRSRGGVQRRQLKLKGVEGGD